MGINTYSDFGSLPFEMQQQIERELDDHEKLVWSGKQVTTGKAFLITIPVALFGIFFGGFAAFWIFMAFTIGGEVDEAPSFFRYVFPLFGIPFLLVGIAMMTSPIWVPRRLGKNFYALTDKRAIVWMSGFFGGVNVRSYTGEDLSELSRNEYGEGRGDLIFQTYTTTGYHRTSSGMHRQRTHVHHLGFMGIENVREVEELLRENLLPDGR